VVCSEFALVSVYDFYRDDKRKSYVTIGMQAAYISGELGAEARSEWGWYTPSVALELNLFPADKILIERFVSGVIYT
jgi:hypothetical protein